MPAPDRLQMLLAQNRVTGIDFVRVDPTQTTLDVHFHRDPAGLVAPLPGSLAPAAVEIRSSTGEGTPVVVPVRTVAWPLVDGTPVLRLTTDAPGDFVRYRLTLHDARIDRYYRTVDFSFKAECPSALDCVTDDACPTPSGDVPDIDYSARDFWSFRRALLDMASARYPDWQERSVADAAVMLAEVMSALGDEMAYTQDRLAREAHVDTAVERRSLRRHAQLMDYPVHDGRAAEAWLEVEASAAGLLPAGTPVRGERDDGTEVVFEVGRGLGSTPVGGGYAVDPARNLLPAHVWDEDDTCLPAGADDLFVVGHRAAVLPLDDVPPGAAPGRWLLLRTAPTNPADPNRRWLVRATTVEETRDEVLGVDVTRIAWDPEWAPPFDMDLTTLSVRGNVVPATAGETSVVRFSIGPSADPLDHGPAVEREGPDGSVRFRFTLPDPGGAGLCRLGPDAPSATPEVDLHEVTWDGAAWVDGDAWTWRRSLLAAPSSLPWDGHFTLEDGVWGEAAEFHRPGARLAHTDYLGDAGTTVRFGDGELGRIPAEGTVFQVRYRLGNGPVGNVPADTLSLVDPATAPMVAAVTNPLPAVGGTAPETEASIRRAAPRAFRLETYRAVREEDYAEAAERLDWVQRAGAAFRWTGSWLTAFVTPDPEGASTLSPEQARALAEHVDAFRQVGRPVHVLEPVYADLDLEITLCVASSAYRGDVLGRVRAALVAATDPGAFFHPDRFTFGTPLRRAALEAAIQAVPGVKAVEGMRLRRRGWFDWRPFDELVYPVAPRELVRVADDPLHPDRGSIRLVARGGA